MISAAITTPGLKMVGDKHDLALRYHPIQCIQGIGDMFVARSGDSVCAELLQHDLAVLSEPWRLLTIVPQKTDYIIPSVEDVCKRAVLVIERWGEARIALRTISFVGIHSNHKLTATIKPLRGPATTVRLGPDGVEAVVGSTVTLKDSASGTFSFTVPNFLSTTGVFDTSAQRSIEVEGKSYHCHAQSAASVARLLRRIDFRPVTSVKLRGGEIGLSALFPIDNSRLASVAWVSAGKHASLRLFYRSNSQGLFRLLPAVNIEALSDSLDVSGYDKGPGEGAITACAGVQRALSKMIIGKTLIPGVDEPLGQLVLQHVVRVNRFLHEGVLWDKSSENPKGQLKPRKLMRPIREASLLKTDRGMVAPPELILIHKREKRPDFLSGPRTRYEMESALSGKLRALVYLSYDRTLAYTLLVDSDHVAWFGQVEAVRAPLTNTGVRATYPVAEDLISPRWEYPVALPKRYWGKPHPHDPSYVDGVAYLNKIPELRRWQRLRRLKKLSID